MAMPLEPGIADLILKAVDDENGVEEKVWVQILEAEYKFWTKLRCRFDPSTGKKGFSQEKSALKADMGYFDYEKFLFPMMPRPLQSEFSALPVGRRFLPAPVIALDRALFLQTMNLLGWDLLLLIFSLQGTLSP